MQLAQAIQQRATPLAEAQNTYKQNVVMVNTFVTSVLSSKLPTTLSSLPPDWQAFMTAYEQANATALNWVNIVMARLLDVPGDVQTYNNVISQVLQDAKQQATLLSGNPGNRTALDTLNADLTTLTNQFGLITTFLSSAITNLRNFKSSMPTLGVQLQTIAQKSAADAQADQKQIDQLNKAIGKLNDDIASLTTSLILLGITDVGVLTLGVVVTIALWPLGALVWFMLGPVVAVASTYIALDAEQIKADKAAIYQKQQEITGLTADVSILNLLANQYTAMAGQTAQIESSLQAILAEWQTLETDVTQAVTDIRSAISDTRSTDWGAVVSDLNDAITQWTAAYAQAGALAITLQVNNAQLQPGMSSADVQQAMAGGQTMDIIQYYNSIG
ncbi:MAG TPA: hypothetical protein VIQ24_08655 [Pyrinomonadaceae bacterium]